MDAIILKVLSVLLIANIVLAGLDAGLEKVKDLTKTDLDNKAYAIVHALASIVQKAIQLIGNRQPAQPATPAAGEDKTVAPSA
jgi:hypothetical protein